MNVLNEADTSVHRAWEPSMHLRSLGPGQLVTTGRGCDRIRENYAPIPRCWHHVTSVRSQNLD